MSSAAPGPDGVSKLVRAHLLVLLAVTCLTARFSYAYFHIDEYFQVIELVRFKLGQFDGPLPWEHTERMRPWLQPFLYWTVGRALGTIGVRDLFTLAFVFRLLTGLANVGALALFLRTTLPWFKTWEEQRLHVRVATLLGFLPYLFVRTSSESGSMAALTAGWALLLEGATRNDDGRSWSVPRLAKPLRVVGAGLLFGVAFEMRFQTALLVVGLVGWLWVVGRARVAVVGWLTLGGGAALGIGALVDRWGYGAWTFPAWTYFQANVLEGAAGLFGTDPPFAYYWMLPANVGFPLVIALLVLALVAWFRCPRHPVTWTTVPFFVAHNLLPHKEERFLFPMAILSVAFVTMAIGPSSGRSLRVAGWGWRQRERALGKILVGSSMVLMVFLAFVPVGWNHHVRFYRYVHDHIGDELHASVLPEIDMNLPEFHPRIHEIDKVDPEELGRRIEAGTAREWLITDRPVLETGVPLVDSRATLVWTELPGDAEQRAKLWRLVKAYNDRAKPPLRKLRYRSLYRIAR